MDQSKIDMFVMTNREKFSPQQWGMVMEKLSSLPDSKYTLVMGASYKDPTTMLILSIFLGIERLVLGDVALGILKLITCWGMGIWWLIDLFLVKQMTYDYNFKKFNESLMY